MFTSQYPDSKLDGQALVLNVEGKWHDLTGVREHVANLTNQVRSIALVMKAVTLGSLSRQIGVDLQ